MVVASDVDRLFLQAILSRGLMSSELTQLLWEKSIKAVNAAYNLNLSYSNNRASWDEFVAKVNSSLDKLDLEFRTIHDESSGREMYAVVNRKGDEIAQMATDYTPSEISFFKAIVEQIMLAPRESFSVSSLAVLRELNALKLNMTKSQAEVVLASFVAKGWLLKSKVGRYSLSSRSLLELLPYIKSTYPDEIVECTICMEVMTRGVSCYTPNCKSRLHFHCFATYRRRHNTCPSCNKEWPREAKDKPLILVGEEASRDGDDRKRRARADVGASDENSSDGDEDNVEIITGKRHATEMNNDMDVDSEDEEVPPTQRNRRNSRRHA